MHVKLLTREQGQMVLWITLFSSSSVAMILGNKAVLNALPFPLALTFLQLLFAGVFTLPLVIYRGRTQLTARQTSYYVLEGVLFSASIGASLESLSLTNVGTVTIARSGLPVVVYLLEMMLMRNVTLSIRSRLSLAGVIAFGAAYAVIAKGLRGGLSGVLWVTIWVLLVAIQMVYGKWLVAAVPISDVERVFYTNTFGLPVLFPLASREIPLFIRSESFRGSAELVFFSCIVGVSIGYTSWKLRSLVSATTFSLVGVLNKMGTVLLAFWIWPDEGSWASLLVLIGCLLSGMMYEGTKQRSLN